MDKNTPDNKSANASDAWAANYKPTDTNDQSGKPNNPDPKNMLDKSNPNPQSVPHQAIAPADVHKESGKDIGLVDAPLQSLNPTSGGEPEADDEVNYDIIDEPNLFLNSDAIQKDFKYPFDELDQGQGMFIPVARGSTTDALMKELHDMVNSYREQTAECEKDKNGDDVWESVVIQTKKRTDDGVVQLSGEGRPIVGANQTNRPKLIYSANFVVRPVVKGDEISDGQEADSDGAMVIRVV